MTLPANLPKPDDFGNYWLGAKPQGPAIFTALGTKAPKRSYFASLGGDAGLLFDGPILRYFSGAADALAELTRVDKQLQRKALKGR